MEIFAEEIMDVLYLNINSNQKYTNILFPLPIEFNKAKRMFLSSGVSLYSLHLFDLLEEFPLYFPFADIVFLKANLDFRCLVAGYLEKNGEKINKWNPTLLFPFDLIKNGDVERIRSKLQTDT